jgi:hypothetical protein
MNGIYRFGRRVSWRFNSLEQLSKAIKCLELTEIRDLLCSAWKQYYDYRRRCNVYHASLQRRIQFETNSSSERIRSGKYIHITYPIGHVCYPIRTSRATFVSYWLSGIILTILAVSSNKLFSAFKFWLISKINTEEEWTLIHIEENDYMKENHEEST